MQGSPKAKEEEQAILEALQAADCNADEANWKPRKLRTLMTPAYCVPVPKAVERFDSGTLRRAVRQTGANTLIVVKGRLVTGIRPARDNSLRPMAMLLDRSRNKHRIWIDVDPDDVALYGRLFQLHGYRVPMFGRVYQRGRHWFIHDPEPMPNKWLGGVRPVYSLHHSTLRSLKKTAPDEVMRSYLADAKIQNEYRRSVNDEDAFRRYLSASTRTLLEAGLKDREARWVATGQTLTSSVRGYLAAMLTQSHFPASQADFDEAMAQVNRVAAVCVAADRVKESIEANAKRRQRLAQIQAPRLVDAFAQDSELYLSQCAEKLPFTLTAEQRRAAWEILSDLDSGMPMQRVLSGDVGSGKTGVFTVAVIAMLDAGHRVAVILPSSTLALQTYEKLTRIIPDVAVSLIAGDTRDIDPNAPLWIGTVGIHANTDHAFDLVIMDEQHRYSKIQREAARGEGGHLLEATATCIPRTQALLDAGMLSLSVLHECHVKKTIISRIHRKHDRIQVFHAIRKNIEAGEIVIIIYPGREASSTTGKGKKIHSVKEHAKTWEHHFPGQVAICHGARKSKDNQTALDRIKTGRAHILVATNIVEVGIDIEGVRRVVVVQPERFGLATLHQLRGRAARDGGVGHFDMVLVEDIKDKADKRLNVMVASNDGFALSNYDLMHRGGGDTVESGHRQSGEMPKSPFPDSDIDPETFRLVWEELRAAYIDGLPGDTPSTEHPYGVTTSIQSITQSDTALAH